MRENAGAMKVLYVCTEDWYFVSHRLSLAVAAKHEGYDVTVLVRRGRAAELIEAQGIRVVPFDFSRRGVNPVREVATLMALAKAYRELRPGLLHHVALKPAVYGTIAARLTGIRRVVNALGGLGFVFSSPASRARHLRALLGQVIRLLFARHGVRIIVQNGEDMQVISRFSPRVAQNLRLIRGAGVNLEDFCPHPEPEGTPVVLFAGRMLRDKGVCDFVEAARRLRKDGIAARFVLAGEPDHGNPTSLQEKELRQWEAEGAVQWIGRVEDMPALISGSNIVCLPTVYGEGIPKILLEAAASSRAIVATDWPGCREVVEHGRNGLLVRPRDAQHLADAINELLADASLRKKMGEYGRCKAAKEFSVDSVIAETLKVYQELANA